LIDSEKNKIGWCRRIPTFAPKQVLKALFTAPRRREKRNAWEKMTENDHGRPKKADESQDQETTTPEPVHAGV
jgi:hypothetical protein